MGNYSTRQAQLEVELSFIFDRLMNKNTIEKSDIISVVNKFKELKKTNPDRYKTLANKAIALNENFKVLSSKGRVNPKEWKKLNSIYAEFQGFFPQEEEV